MLWYGDSVLDVPVFKSLRMLLFPSQCSAQSMFVLFLHPIRSRGSIVSSQEIGVVHG
jgi:hypothetical protein